MSKKMFLVRWPESQRTEGVPGMVKASPIDAKGRELEHMQAAYFVPADELVKLSRKPETSGTFIRVEWPDSQAHVEDEGVLCDYEGNVYVPIEE